MKVKFSKVFNSFCNLVFLSSFSILLFACSANIEKDYLSCTLNDQLLKETKVAVANKEPQVMGVFNGLVAQADAYFEMPLLSVVNNDRVPPSGDKHDYVTLSPYWWPNPETDDGLPYVQRDGERNPEVYDYTDRETTGLFGEIVETLGVLYYITEDERYAERASKFLRHWFISTDSRMNPNMIYAQIRPGIDKVRGTGIIDARRLFGAFNGASLIKTSSHWTNADEVQLKEWASEFANWLENSEQGVLENASTNNHGVWYDVIVLNMWFYAENYDAARGVLEKMGEKRIESQQISDGSFPRELSRTLSLHYSTFILEGFLEASSIGSKMDFDLWSYQGDDGSSLKRGVDFLVPYYSQVQDWPYEQLNLFNYNRAAVVLYQTGLSLEDDEYLKVANAITYKTEVDVKSLLYYRINL